uniref:Uncharacterized protein n=1 Tax=Arundo donax TaxID=35708 RepID=A0A0A9G804_ARUDO
MAELDALRTEVLGHSAKKNTKQSSVISGLQKIHPAATMYYTTSGSMQGNNCKKVL